MRAKLKPIEFKNVKQIQMLIKPPPQEKERKIFSRNDLLIATDGNTFYLKDILDISDEIVETGEEIKFLTREDKESYSPSQIKEFYDKNDKKLPPSLALHTALANALNAIQFDGEKVQVLNGRIFDLTHFPQCPISLDNICFPIINVAHGYVCETNLIFAWINKHKDDKKDPFRNKIKFDFFKPDLALQSLLDTEFQYCQISNLENIKTVQDLLGIETSEIDKENEYKGTEKDPEELSELSKARMLESLYLRRKVLGFNLLLNFAASVAFLVIGLLISPFLLIGFFVLTVVCYKLLDSFLSVTREADSLSNTITRNDYNQINQIETYNSSIFEKIQQRKRVKNSTIEKIKEKIAGKRSCFTGGLMNLFSIFSLKKHSPNPSANERLESGESGPLNRR